MILSKMTDDQAKEILSLLKEEVKRRSGMKLTGSAVINGPMRSSINEKEFSWYTLDSTALNKGYDQDVIRAKHGERIINTLLEIKDFGDTKNVKELEKIPGGFDYDLIKNYINKLSQEDYVDASSCRSGCTGLCVGTCGTTCKNGCGDACSACTGTCTNGCKETCNGCSNFCKGGCGTTCGKDCVGQCGTACTGTCEGCSAACTGDCNVQCTIGCRQTCEGACKEACEGGCNNSGKTEACGCGGRSCSDGCGYNATSLPTGGESCENSCVGCCEIDCVLSCENSCKDTCKIECVESCRTECNGCNGTCEGECADTCKTQCSIYCGGNCERNCAEQSCFGMCKVANAALATCDTCKFNCTSGCYNDCTGGTAGVTKILFGEEEYDS